MCLFGIIQNKKQIKEKKIKEKKIPKKKIRKVPNRKCKDCKKKCGWSFRCPYHATEQHMKCYYQRLARLRRRELPLESHPWKHIEERILREIR